MLMLMQRVELDSRIRSIGCRRIRAADGRRASRGGLPFAQCLLLSAALLLSGCMSAPVDQIRYFSQAFAAVNTVGQPLLDDLAIAERAQGKQIAQRRAQGESEVGSVGCPKERVPWQVLAGSAGFMRGYCLPDSGYFSDLGDPPATAQLRGGLIVIERYAAVLSLLADGRNVDGAIGEIGALGQEVGGLLAVAGVAEQPIGAALLALQPILASAARQANAAEARRLILEGAPKVSALLAALYGAAPAMFDTLIEASAQRAVLLEQPGPVAAEVARIEAYRVAVANYVVLLQQLQSAWDATLAAATAPQGQAGVASLVAQMAALRSNAEAARRVFAVLRMGGVPAAGR